MKQKDMKKKRLTRKEVQLYLRRDGVRCPYCGSEELAWDALEFEPLGITQHVICIGCDRDWTDLYDLVDVVEGEA